MADELTSVDNASAAPEGQPQTSGTNAPQNTVPQENKTEKIDLFKLPEFKGYQAQMNRTVTALQQELAQLRQQQTQAAMSGMNDLERATFLLQEKDKELAQYRAYMEEQQNLARKMEDVRELSEMTGAPIGELANATSYDEAVKMSIAYMRKNGASEKEIRVAKQEANRVDLGGGSASTPVERDGIERAQLLKSGDTKSLFLKILEG